MIGRNYKPIQKQHKNNTYQGPIVSNIRNLSFKFLFRCRINKRRVNEKFLVKYKIKNNVFERQNCKVQVGNRIVILTISALIA